jgi:photosystem II stability/assembly factor-like uncharacterized protein
MPRWILVAVCLTVVVAPATAQEWRPVTEAIIKSEEPGYGGLCGVVVDHATGDLIINLSDKGLYRSTDQGQSWKPIGKQFKGRTETPGCLMLDPIGGKRLVSAFVYGSPILVSPDRGESGQVLDKKSHHVDWCAVDWSDPELRFILTLKHESGDLLLVSHDGGKSFDEVGKGYGPAWIFDKQTAVVAQAKTKANNKPGLLRTTDAGKTFEPCGAYYARALPRWHKDTLYWVVDGALIATRDQGKSWQKISDLKNGRAGPVFGKNADHLFVLTQAGIVESTDAGKSWGKVILAPKDMKGIDALSWLEYDPVHDTVYIMKMRSDLYRWQRAR